MFTLTLELTQCDSKVSLLSSQFADGEQTFVTNCQRGANVFRRGVGAFTWSVGVQALVYLCIEVKLAYFEGRQGALTGGRESLAAALDSALSKNTQWLADMFGVFEDGSLRARRILRRTNPERKRPGPVEIFVNQTSLPAHCISIRLDGRNLTSKEELESLSKQILQGTRGRTTARTVHQSGAKSKAGSEINSLNPQMIQWSRAFEEELQFGLAGIPLYDRHTSVDVLKRIFANPSCQGFRPSNQTLNEFIEPQLSDRVLLGLASPNEFAESLRRLEKIRVKMVSVEVGAVALFTEISRVFQLDIELDYSFAHGGEVLDEALEGRNDAPHLCLMPLAGTAPCWTGCFSERYVPVTIMPESTKKVIGRPLAMKKAPTFYSYFVRQPTSASLFFDDLVNAGLRGEKLDSENPLYFIEASRILRDGVGDVRAVLWFPFHKFNIWFNDCSEIEIPYLSHRHPTSSVLFMRRDVAIEGNYAQALAALIRHVWLSLRENPARVTNVASTLAGMPDYVRSLGRLGGLHTDAFRWHNAPS